MFKRLSGQRLCIHRKHHRIWDHFCMCLSLKLGRQFLKFLKYREVTVKEGRNFYVVKILLANKQVLLLSEMDQ